MSRWMSPIATPNTLARPLRQILKARKSPLSWALTHRQRMIKSIKGEETQISSPSHCPSRPDGRRLDERTGGGQRTILDLQELEVADAAVLRGGPSDGRAKAGVIVGELCVQRLLQAGPRQIAAGLHQRVHQQLGVNIAIEFVRAERWIARRCLQICLADGRIHVGIAADINALARRTEQFGP